MPVNIIVLGMAGTGKTTFVNQFAESLRKDNKNPYIVNLDPAVHHVPYKSNIDIRDTVKYKEVMKQYGFGPNGAIMTCLNFYTSQFHKVIEIISTKKEHDYIIFDTPGQIEVFTWSASGMIITETLASLNPTIILYVVDTPRCRNPVTFMSNMLYTCSVMYKMRLPLLCVFNKTDVISCNFAKKWMTDFEEFQEALSVYNNDPGPISAEKREEYASIASYNVSSSSYMTSLTNSMSLVLDEFYSTISSVGFSSTTGEGFTELMGEIDKCVLDFEDNYKKKLEKVKNKPLRHLMLDPSDNENEEDDETDRASTCSSKSRNSVLNEPRQTMLIDMVGDEDRVDKDINIHIDGLEEKPYDLLEENDAGMENISQKIQNQCKINQ